MSELTQAMGLVIPYVNLVLVAIVLYLFVKLFRIHKKTQISHISPWLIIFFGVLVYVAEAIFTVLRSSGVFDLPYHVNGYFELVIISAFIYAVFDLREHLKEDKKKKKPTLFTSPQTKTISLAPKVSSSIKKSGKKKSSKKKARKKSSKTSKKKRSSRKKPKKKKSRK